MKSTTIVFWLLMVCIIITGLITVVAIFKDMDLSDLSGFYSIMGIFIGLFGGGLLGSILAGGNLRP